MAPLAVCGRGASPVVALSDDWEFFEMAGNALVSEAIKPPRSRAQSNLVKVILGVMVRFLNPNLNHNPNLNLSNGSGRGRIKIRIMIRRKFKKIRVGPVPGFPPFGTYLLVD